MSNVWRNDNAISYSSMSIYCYCKVLSPQGGSTFQLAITGSVILTEYSVGLSEVWNLCQHIYEIGGCINKIQSNLYKIDIRYYQFTSGDLHKILKIQIKSYCNIKQNYKYKIYIIMLNREYQNGLVLILLGDF